MYSSLIPKGKDKVTEPMSVQEQIISTKSENSYLQLFINEQFIVQWKDHEIRGKETYLRPWKEITQYANQVADRLKARFSTTPFLDALKILDPQEWKKSCESYTTSGNIMMSIQLI